jgi:hypothetical protein
MPLSEDRLISILAFLEERYNAPVPASELRNHYSRSELVSVVRSHFVNVGRFPTRRSPYHLETSFWINEHGLRRLDMFRKVSDPSRVVTESRTFDTVVALLMAAWVLGILLFWILETASLLHSLSE